VPEKHAVAKSYTTAIERNSGDQRHWWDRDKRRNGNYFTLGRDGGYQLFPFGVLRA